MVKAVGTKDSGWTTEFFSMQMAAKPAGYPKPDINNKEKYLVITDSDFYPRLAKIEADRAAQKKALDKSLEKQEQLQRRLTRWTPRLPLRGAKTKTANS